jgi:hypothetical protein
MSVRIRASALASVQATVTIASSSYVCVPGCIYSSPVRWAAQDLRRRKIPSRLPYVGLPHLFSRGNVPEGHQEHFFRILQCRIEVVCRFLRIGQIGKQVIAKCSRPLRHCSPHPPFPSLLEIGLLGSLISTTQENYPGSIYSEIHSITGVPHQTSVQTRHPSRLTVPLVSVLLDASDSGVDPVADVAINSSGDPFTKRARASRVG